MRPIPSLAVACILLGAFTAQATSIIPSVSAASADSTLEVEIDPPCVDCTDSDSFTGNLPTALPVIHDVSVRTSSGTGTSTVGANADAFARAVSTAVSFTAGVSLQDAPPEGPHYGARAFASIDSTIRFEVPTAAPDEILFADIFLNFDSVSPADLALTTQQSASFSVTDVLSQSVLFSASDADMFQLDLEFSAWEGRELEASFSAVFEMEGEAGFAGGAEDLTSRVFSNGASAAIGFQVTIIPEPSTVLLLGAGLLGLAARRRAS